MSLLLVLAMVLAMVPAVFAADDDGKKITSFTGTAQYIAPDQSITIDYAKERPATGPAYSSNRYADADEITRWECSNRSLFEVTNQQKTGTGESGTDYTKAVAAPARPRSRRIAKTITTTTRKKLPQHGRSPLRTGR